VEINRAISFPELAYKFLFVFGECQFFFGFSFMDG
jgi:hypothetical protein